MQVWVIDNEYIEAHKGRLGKTKRWCMSYAVVALNN